MSLKNRPGLVSSLAGVPTTRKNMRSVNEFVDLLSSELGALGAVISEIPAGAIDGVNAVFTTAHDFSSISVYNGLRQAPGTDFNVTGANEITFTTPPTVGSTIIVDYIRA